MNDPPIPPGAVILHPAHNYERAPPALAGCWCPDANLLAWFYGNVRQRAAQCPAEYMLRVDGAHVVGGQYLMDRDGQWLPASVMDYPAAEQARPAIAARIGAGDVTRIDGDKPTVMIGKAGSGNYGHILVEILPRLINLFRSPLRNVRLLLPEGMRQMEGTVRRLLERLGITAELVFTPESEIVAMDDLYYFGPVSLHNIRKSTTLLHLRNLIWTAFGTTPEPTRRLYVERPEGEQRGFANGAEVRALMEQAGYETVHPGLMNLEDQVALFSQASHILGGLGAGMANILFAPPTCRVALVDPGLADYFFWDLAALAGQSFTWMFTGPVSFFSQELATRPYPVDMDGLRYLLQQAG